MSSAAPVFFVDTSCIVACVCSWHVHHAQATAEIERRLTAGEAMATAAHAAAEAYAVLTCLPAPHRLSPAHAFALIDSNFLEGAVALDAGGYRDLLRRAGVDGIAGGRTYNAIIAECALRAKAVALLTFNARHFANLESAGGGAGHVDPRLISSALDGRERPFVVIRRDRLKPTRRERSTCMPLKDG